MAPISTPRVGWFKTMISGSFVNSRATIAFWILPRDVSISYEKTPGKFGVPLLRADGVQYKDKFGVAPRYIVFKISSFCFIPTEMSRTRFSASIFRLYFSEIALASSMHRFLSISTPLRGSIPSTRFSVRWRPNKRQFPPPHRRYWCRTPQNLGGCAHLCIQMVVSSTKQQLYPWFVP